MSCELLWYPAAAHIRVGALPLTMDRTCAYLEG
jgi:hypothetical protein